ncbi:MAG: hypothetical protein IPM54_29925 [Polyangiaceae bacterium]|nr:hypothetical protein [Polyangiaceae bacterium]
MRVLEALGRMVGGVLSPLVAIGGLARNARLFHPDGVVYWARVRPVGMEGALGALAERLEGPAIVRFSSAWWRNEKELPDLLGIAIRFIDTQSMTRRNTLIPSPRDQDLLFATVRAVLTLPLAPLVTNVNDFLANDYYALLPFQVPGLGRAKFRLSPVRLRSEATSRRERLAARVAAGSANMRFEVKKDENEARWQEFATVEIEELADIDQESLAMNPFRTGRAIVPVGPIQMVRAAAYPASVVGRRIIPK